MVVGKGAPGGNTQRPHIRPGPGRRNPLQRRQNFLRLGLGHLTQHHELIPTDAEDFPPIPHRLGDIHWAAPHISSSPASCPRASLTPFKPLISMRKTVRSVGTESAYCSRHS